MCSSDLPPAASVQDVPWLQQQWQQQPQQQALLAQAANVQGHPAQTHAPQDARAPAHTPGRFDNQPGLDHDVGLRMALIMVHSQEEKRPFDALGQEIQERCWAFSLNHHERTDAEGKVYEDCGRNASDCFRSHIEPEKLGQDALDRMEKLRNTQLDRQKKGRDKRAEKGKGGGKGSKNDGVKGVQKAAGFKGQQSNYGQQASPAQYARYGTFTGKGYCSFCEMVGHRNQDCNKGGAEVDWQKQQQQQKGGARPGKPIDMAAMMREVAVAAVAEYASLNR